MAANTVQKIRAGLNARNIQRGEFSLDHLIGSPTTFSELTETVGHAINGRDILRSLAAKTTAEMEAFERASRKELKETGVTREARGDGSFHVQDLWNDNARETELAKRLKDKRAELRQQTAEKRAGAEKAVREALRQIENVRESFSDPVVFLDKMTLTSERRAAIRENLKLARPRQLEGALRDGVIAKDTAKVAACIEVLDNMPPEDQAAVRISRAEAAAFAAGEDWLRVAQYLAVADLAKVESELAGAQIDGKRNTNTLALELGKLKVDLAKLHGETDFESVAEEVRTVTAPDPNPEYSAEFEEQWQKVLDNAKVEDDAA